MQKCRRNEQILEVKYAKMKFTEGGIIKLRFLMNVSSIFAILQTIYFCIKN